MNTPFDSDTLAAAEVCFAVASQLLYLEPEIAPVAEQVASRSRALPLAKVTTMSGRACIFLTGGVQSP